MYDISQLKALSKSIVIFDESAITSILPQSRKRHSSCKSNTSQQNTELYSRYVRSHEVGNQPIFEWIDAFSQKQVIAREMSRNRYNAWNFKPITQCGSVEFRRPPPVATYVEALQWISISLCFAWYSIMYGNSLLQEFSNGKADCNHLRHAVYEANNRLRLHPGYMMSIEEERREE